MIFFLLLLLFLRPQGVAAGRETFFLFPHIKFSTGSYVRDKSKLWPGAEVPYRIENDEWMGTVEPVFTDNQIENITRALQHIQDGVPCILFRFIGQSVLLFIM